MGWAYIRGKNMKGFASFIAYAAAFLIPFAAWLTHVVVCLSQGRWGFLIAGGIFFPIAIVHGIGYWLGFFH